MGTEIDLLAKYPKSKRAPRNATKHDQAVARQFGKKFFDGERCHGYGGYHYDPRFWQPVVQDFVEWFGQFDSILDVGCAKGFMLHDFKQALQHLAIFGVDISRYAVNKGHPPVRYALDVASAVDLPFRDKEIEIVVSINTIHNLDRKGVIRALREIQRVGDDAFITVDAYRDAEERERMLAWNLTAKTILHVDDWVKLFAEAGYKGDWYYFFP